MTHRDTTLILAAHGSTVNADSSRPAMWQAARLRALRRFAQVLCAFWKEEPTFHQVFAQVETNSVVIVPFFLAEGYFTRTVLPQEVQAAITQGWGQGKSVRFTNPVGTHPRITEVLLARAREMLPTENLSSLECILVAHGTELNANSRSATEAQAEALHQSQTFRRVHTAFMEEAPNIRDWRTISQSPTTLVLPFFLSDGLHAREDIPQMMGLAPGTWGGPHQIDGRTLFYGESLGMAPELTDVLLQQAEDFS